MTRKMKDSEIEWIGEIPVEWELCRLQFCLDEINVKNNPVQTNKVLSLVKDRGVMPYEDKGNQGNKAKEDVSEYKLAYPNTLVVNSMNILIGSVGLCDYFGCVSPVYYVFKDTDAADLRFVNYIFNTRPFQSELRKYAKGILEIRLRVSADDIFKQRIALPAKDVQIRIADFLDGKCAEIDGLVADIQEQIAVLEQYKKSVIFETVTKGMNPDVEMKDSGVEWIGEIPEHWGIKSIRHLTSEHFTGSWGNDERYNANDRICMRIADFDFDKMQFKVAEDDAYSVRNYSDSDIYKRTLRYGDLLLEKSGGGEKTPVGRTVVYRLPYNALFANFLDCIRLTKEYGVEFAKFVFYSLYHRGVTNLYFNQTTGLQNLNVSKYLREAKLPVPNLAEQQEIANYLDGRCAEIDAVIGAKREQLEVLGEYKKSLIFEYVTGKKEVP